MTACYRLGFRLLTSRRRCMRRAIFSGLLLSMGKARIAVGGSVVCSPRGRRPYFLSRRADIMKNVTSLLHLCK
jgi:hypothetical protein